ncbi:FHA domain-containing protein [Massilia glaciei]|uniref:FHA domain-containing protein n=1 Tax=Massilia glaciei TaxID=1524097 RepID=A0A2U2I4S3_9BURK|nr:FHA domain-containing protein [Massilia glaciei]PWF54733.1 FHA domain-containing protein [Massilia glaciei]
MAKIIISHDGQVLQEVQLSKDRITIGRHPQCDVVIEHRAISAQHAAISTALDEAMIEDLGSTNGTFVNGRRINKQVLADHDRIVLAMIQIEFVAGPVAASKAAAAAMPLGHVEVRSGPHAGKKLPLSKPLTTLGTPGTMVLAISRTPDGYMAAHIDGAVPPGVNGAPLGTQPRKLVDGDLIDLGGTQMAFSCP